MRRLHYGEYKKGFTLIEVLVGVFIFTLIGAAIAVFQRDTVFLNAFLSENLTAQGETRRAFKGMTAEVRSLSSSSLGAYPVVEASATSFTFYTTIDDDALKEKIRYFLDGTTLKKGVIKPSGAPLSYNPATETITEIVHNVANGATPIFSYYDTGYDGTTAPLGAPVNIPSVRLVKITVLIDENTLRPPGVITFTTQVSMRNVKDNL